MNMILALEHELFKALADRTRLRIAVLLTGRELCVCDLTRVLALPQSSVSRHMSVLKTGGLVLDRREGKWVHYRLSEIPPLNELKSYFLSMRRREPYFEDQKSLQEYLKVKKC
jgi:DNA-binding transcriptional ArsR family regulator